MKKNVKRNLGKVLVAAAVITTLFSVTAEARNIGQLSLFAVPISSTHSQVPTGQSKVVTGIPAVVNLNAVQVDNGRPTIHVEVRDSSRNRRASGTMTRGQRRTFAMGNAQSDNVFWLWLRGSNPANAQIQAVGVSGSWSPDCTTAADIHLNNCF